MDPTIYKYLNDDDKKSAKKLIFKKLNNLPSTISSSRVLSSSSTSTSKIATSKPNSLQYLAMICGHSVTFTTSAVSKQPITLDEELSLYVDAARSATDFQEFWITHEKSLPRLARLVRRTNIIPATSVASEALFSIASFLNRKQRSSLSSRTLRYLLVLKSRHNIDKLELNC